MHTSSYRHPVRPPYTPPSSAPRSGTPSSSYMASTAGRTQSQEQSPALGTTGRDFVDEALEEVDRVKGIADVARQNGDFEKVYRYYRKAANIIHQLLSPDHERKMSSRLRTSLIRTINGLEKWLDDYDKYPQRRHDRVSEWVATDKMDGSPAFESHLRRDELAANARVRAETQKDRLREKDLLERDDHDVERMYAKGMMKEKKEAEAGERAEARKKRDKERGRERRSKVEGRRDYMPGGDDSFAPPSFAPPPFAPAPVSSTSSDGTVRGDRGMGRRTSVRAGKENVDYSARYSIHDDAPAGQPIPPLTPDKTPEQGTDSGTDATPHFPPEPYMRGRSLDYDTPARRVGPRGGNPMPSPPEDNILHGSKDARPMATPEYQQWQQIQANDPPPPRNAPQWEHEEWIKRNGRKLPPRIAALHEGYGNQRSSSSQDDNPFIVRGTPPTASSRSRERYTESPTVSEAVLDPGSHVHRRPSNTQRASSLPVESSSSSGKSTPLVKTPNRGATEPAILPSQKRSPVSNAWEAVPGLKSPPLVGPGRTLGPHRTDSTRWSNPSTPTHPERRGSVPSSASPVVVKGSGQRFSSSQYSFPHEKSPYGKANEAGAPLISNSVDRSVIRPPEDSALFNSTPGDLVKVPKVPFGAVAPQDPSYWRLPPHERPVQIQMPMSSGHSGIPRLRAVYLPPNYMKSFLDNIVVNRRAGLETMAVLLAQLDTTKNGFYVTTLLFPPQRSYPQFSRITDDAAVESYCERLNAKVVGVLHWSFAGNKNAVNSFTGWDLHMLYKYQSAVPETVGVAVTTRPEDAGKAVHLMRSLSEEAMQEISHCHEQAPYHFHGDVDEVFTSRPRGNLEHVHVDDGLHLHVEDMRS
ncbi:hypothetical protein CALCODRAFT_492934 [Calocera cornea HHB12733]|uniref:MIT domain-containing protein n=1 Tax=Calocera cornea HHB12733 TaxID=1353952 RepID=A0A165HZQ7_9BASI|nr:hypothetical protein CALCODRAFT_492934 [Calocera cornea HHB12733]